jgi:hypothetical protein
MVKTKKNTGYAWGFELLKKDRYFFGKYITVNTSKLLMMTIAYSYVLLFKPEAMEATPIAITVPFFTFICLLSFRKCYYWMTKFIFSLLCVVSTKTDTLR